MFAVNALPFVDNEGKVKVDLEFKTFFVSLVERNYQEGQSLARIREDISAIRRELDVEGLEALPLEQWAEESIFALKRRENLPAQALAAQPNLAVCTICGKVGPYKETNCASFCPYGA